MLHSVNDAYNKFLEIFRGFCDITLPNIKLRIKSKKNKKLLDDIKSTKTI